MILLHASAELKAVFQKVIKNMDVNVVWDGVFAVTFNNLILLGKVRSLFFNFDNKKANTNIIDIEVTDEMLQETSDYEHLANVINMTLYAFGKWGAIKGLKVDQDYAKLNGLFRGILKDISVEPSFRDDNYRFFKNKVQITYEDVIQEILDLSNGKESDALEEQAEGVSSDEEAEGRKLGLWHNMTWKITSRSFHKKQRLEEEAVKSRLGNEFYMVDYKCPDCGEKLYMALFPVDKEFLIETEESRVYLARVYACDVCNCFYTPRPGKLLQEGDIYILDFEDDRNAYKDYLELLGRQGSGSANYKFNEYESDRNKNEPLQTLEEVCDAVETISEEEWNKVNEKMSAGFYSPSEIKKIGKAAERRLKLGNKSIKAAEAEPGKKESVWKEKAEKEEKKVKKEHDLSSKTIDELKEMRRTMESGKHGAEQIGEVTASLDKIIGDKVKEKFDAHMEVLERMSKKQLGDLKSKIQSEPALNEEEKETYVRKVDQVYFRQEEKDMKQMADACKEKSYAEINRTIEKVKESGIPEDVRESMLAPLREASKIKGQKEVDALISHIPSQLNKKQLQTFREKLAQYQDIDTSAYQKQLDQKADMAEQTEIREFMKRSNAKDRNALLHLSEQLKKQGYDEQNLALFLDQVHDQIYAIDEAAIQKICPDILGISFEDGMKAYKEIEEGIFLPELKTNTLEMLDRRLTKMKMDENEQLVRKLQKDMDKSVKDYSNLYFYESRKMMRGDVDEKALGIINRALNSYASSRNKYEFPIIISDASHFPNGKEGFVLTPDHIFYRTLLSSGSIPVLDVEDLAASTGLLNKGMYANRKVGKRVKLPNKIASQEWKAVTESISRFIEYLHEKPESRNVSYLQKDKHEVICCYRCGQTFTSGDTCPKCGSKANH